MIVSVHSKIARITEAFRAGATGYVTKELVRYAVRLNMIDVDLWKD